MRAFRYSLLIAGVLALGACTNFDSHSEVKALNEVQPVGSPFTQYLTEEYRMFANSEMNDMMDYPDALHFARKGLASAGGEVVMPEPISDWNLNTMHMEELSAARGRLLVAFDLGGREIAPQQAAIAQARFDCWIEQQEENWQDGDIAACKNEYLSAINALEGMIGPVMPVAELAPIVSELPPAAEPMLPEEAMYLVFFDHDSFKITAGANNVLDAVSGEITARNVNTIKIVGHTDRSGPAAYNERLSTSRGNAVRDALIARGVDGSMLRVESRGEGEMLVETSDGVREPANRRAQITFE
jgi:OOP family OmpA-OmpF porin